MLTKSRAGCEGVVCGKAKQSETVRVVMLDGMEEKKEKKERRVSRECLEGKKKEESLHGPVSTGDRQYHYFYCYYCVWAHGNENTRNHP
jgi:hypothetical protein